MADSAAMVFPVQDPRSMIGAITLDVLVSEGIRLPSMVTAYPVEDGTVITDHVVQEQEELVLDGMVTGSVVAPSDPGGGKARIIDVRDALRTIHAERQPIVIVTGIDVYQDMVMESCDIGRGNQNQFVNVRATFRKIRRVTTKTADVPPEKVAPKASGKAGTTKQNAGKANQQEMGPQDQRTKLKKSADAIKSKLGR